LTERPNLKGQLLRLEGQKRKTAGNISPLSGILCESKSSAKLLDEVHMQVQMREKSGFEGELALLANLKIGESLRIKANDKMVD
jgi:hypothetical protein